MPKIMRSKPQPHSDFIVRRDRSALLHIMVCSRLLQVLKADKRAIFTAAAKAQAAADYVLSRTATDSTPDTPLPPLE